MCVSECVDVGVGMGVCVWVGGRLLVCACVRACVRVGACVGRGWMGWARAESGGEGNSSGLESIQSNNSEMRMTDEYSQTSMD